MRFFHFSVDQYVGRWVGDFTIYSAAECAQTFPVEQRFWWEDGALRAVSVSGTDGGLQIARPKTIFTGERFGSEVVRGESVENYVGMLHEDVLIWISADLARATDNN